jgi:CMP-N,N'-diacetyllegionaminic acid synthase
MRILALVTARGGSKRLPGKNVRLLGGKPLFEWSIDVIKGNPKICDILVSTDDSEIAEIARNSGVLIPWLRPKELATDTASSVDVSLHALDWYEEKNGKIDGLLLLQPTSPFRSCGTVLRGIELFHTHQRHPVVAVSLAKSHPMSCCLIKGETMSPFVDGGGFHLLPRDLTPVYEENGAFYLITPEDLRKQRSFYSGDMVPLVIDKPEESIDIDTKQDWDLAEVYLKSGLIPKPGK